jgi:hypothetical protein
MGMLVPIGRHHLRLVLLVLLPLMLLVMVDEMSVD